MAMRTSRHAHRLATTGLLLAALAASAVRSRADTPPPAGLADSSPFAPVEAKGAAAGQADAGPVELRGILNGAQGPTFCIYDTARKSGTWVGQADRTGPIVVRSFDLSRESVVVEIGGRVTTLTLKQAKVASDNGPSRPVGPPAGFTGQPQPNYPIPTPAEEAKSVNWIISQQPDVVLLAKPESPQARPNVAAAAAAW